MKKKIIGIIAMMGLSISLMGCSSGYKNYNESTEKDLPNPSYTELVENEVYYLPHDSGKKDFPLQYKNFKEKNPHLKIKQVEQDAQEGTEFNYVNGYFVFTELKSESKGEK